MMWEDSVVNQLEFVTDCSCSAAKRQCGSWPAAALVSSCGGELVLLMVWRDSYVNWLELVTLCSCSAAGRLHGSWPATARHHGSMQSN